MRSFILGILAIAILALGAGVAAAQVPASTDSIVAQARAAAQQDRHAEAAALFSEAIKQDPSRRMRLLLEYADEVSYTNAKGAIPLYHELLASPDITQPDAVKARLGLANALASDGQSHEAAAQYRSVVKQDSNNVDARLDYAQFLWDQGDLGGARTQYIAVMTIDPSNVEAKHDFARLESWRTRYRESKRLSEEYLSQNTGDRESEITLAQDELWMSRPDEARASLHSVTQADPKNADAGALLTDIGYATAPSVEAVYETATQSDNLLIQTARLNVGVTPDSGRTTLGAFYEGLHYSATDQDAIIDVHRPGITLAHHFSDWSQLEAEYSPAQISSPQDSTINSTIPTYNANLSFWANDTFQFSLQSRRQIFDNLLSLAKGITANIDSAAVNFTPDERTEGNLRVGRGYYSDGNEETAFEFTFERRVVRRPDIRLGVNATQAEFSQVLNNGYFNPSYYHGIQATAAISNSLGRRFDYDIDAGLGTEYSNPGGSDTAYSLNGTVGYHLSRAAELEIYYEAYNTYQAGNNGFTRHAFGLTLNQKI